MHWLVWVVLTDGVGPAGPVRVDSTGRRQRGKDIAGGFRLSGARRRDAAGLGSYRVEVALRVRDDWVPWTYTHPVRLR